MNKRMGICAALLVAGCAQQPNVSSDMLVIWHDNQSAEELQKTCGHRIAQGDASMPMGCFVKDKGICHIYTMKQEDYISPKTGKYNPLWWYAAIGHELRHCRDGAFHS